MDNATGTEAPKTLDDEVLDLATAVRDTAYRWRVPEYEVLHRLNNRLDSRSRGVVILSKVGTA